MEEVKVFKKFTDVDVVAVTHFFLHFHIFSLNHSKDWTSMLSGSVFDYVFPSALVYI